MANNQVKVSLMFSADTSKAQSSLKNLQTSLNDLTKSVKIGDFKITDQVKEAYEATEKLKQALNASVNMSTGQFDLSGFQTQLKSAGINVQDLSKKMAEFGPAGVKAFNDVAIAIANAEIPTKRVNEWLDKMAKSLKDTMRWQISSSIIHGFQGALQQAYGYAQDLNRSLNDIRIVTSYSSEDMANFAEQANKAAKALSTSTNEYAKASLIYYQQGGMSDEEVAKRTAATIKMANVTGESAQDISSYMTAIWNNFEDGSKSLEYYADVIAKLGAETASSSEEIATGMQKFASVAETVGLSYEYAASALATVVAATRQSEDTVGTSLKTIFARLSSLSLGETLDDDTTLTKYSQALAKVGVNIKDSNGEIKKMDDILDELGAKWNNINKEQQTALAYTVAGVRQQTNFIALMDNYKTFKVNVDLAEDSEGTLEEQQKIYEESWQAAADRVRTAAEGIFQDLIDDDFFINLLDGFEKLLSMLDQFIDAIGGLPGVLSLVSSLMLRIFSTQAKQGLENLGYNLKSFLGINQQQSTKTKEEFLQASKKSAEDMMSRVDVKDDPALQAELDSLAKRSELEREYIRLEGTLTEQQKEKYLAEMKILDVLQQQKKVKHQEMSEVEDETRGTIGAVIREATEAAQKKSWEGQQQNTKEQLQASITGYEENQARRAEEIKGYDDRRRDARWSVNAKQHQLDAIDAKILAQAEFNAQAQGEGTLTTEDTLKLEELANERASIKQSLQQAKAIIEEMDQAVALAVAEQDQTAEMLKESKEALAAMNDATWDKSSFDMSQSALVGETFQDYIDKETSSINRELELQSLLKASANLPDAQANPEAHQQALEQLQNHLTEFNEKYSEELGEETRKVIEAIIADVQSDFSTEDGGASITSDTIQKYSEQVKQATRTDASKELGNIRDSLSSQGIEFSDEQFTIIQASLDDYIKKIRQAAEVTQQETEVMSESLQNLEDKGKEPIPYKFSESFINLSQGITSATTALASFQGIWSTLTNPDLSGWEKFTTVLMSIGTVVGSVISAISALQQVQFKQMGITIKNTAADIANALAKKINTKLTKENTDAKRANAQATDASTKETNEETGAKILNSVTEKATSGKGKAGFGTKIKGGFKNFGKGFSTTVKGMGGKGAATAATAGSGGAAAAGTTGAAASTTGAAATTAGGSVASALGSIAAVAVPIAIAAAAIAGAIAIVTHIYQAAEKSAKKAEKQAERLRAAAAEVKQEYQDTVDTINNYQNALDGIEKLTKGTQEWRDAIAESNDQARELIDRFGEDLQAGDYYFEDGQIKFKEGVLENLQKKEHEAMLQAQAGADSASAIALEKRNEADKIAFARKEMRTGQASWKETAGTLAATTGIGLAAGAAIGSVVPVIGTAIGAAVGAAVGAIGGIVTTSIAGAASKAEQEALDKLTDLYRKDSTIIDQMAAAQKSGKLNEFAKQYGISEELANTLLKNKDATEELIVQMAANANEIQLLRESMVGNANAGKTVYDNAKNQEYINAKASQLMKDPTSQEYKDAQAKIDEKLKGSNKDFWEEYLEKVIGDSENYRITNQAGKNVTLQKKDEHGNWVTDETLGKNGLSEEDAIAALRDVYIADLTEQTIQNLDNESIGLATDLKNSGISDEKTANKIVTAWARGEGVDLSSLTEQQLNNLSKNIDSIGNKDLAKAVSTAQANASKSWKTMMAEFSGFTQMAINEIDAQTVGTTEEVTRDQLKSYGQTLEQLTELHGIEVASAFKTNLHQLLEDNKDSAQEIMEIIAGIDWSNTEEGLWAFQNGLSEIGVYIDIMSWDIEGLGKKFGDINFSPGFLNSLDLVVQKLANVLNLSDIKIGDAIDQNTYSALSEIDKGQFVESAPKVVLSDDGKWVEEKQYVRVREAKSTPQDIYKKAIQDAYEKKAKYKDALNVLSTSYDPANESLNQVELALTEQEIVKYQNWLASSATSIAELDDYVSQNLISETLKNKYLPILNSQLENLKEQMDIYEDEEAQIEVINRQLEEQQKITEKLHGEEKIQSLRKELSLNRQLLSVNRKGLKVAEQDLQNETKKFEKAAAEKWGEDFTDLIKYDEFGNISNWEKLRSYLLYTEGTIEVDLFDTYRDNIVKAEGKVEEFTESIKENEEAINSYWGSQAETISQNYDFIAGKQENLKSQIENYRNIIDLIGKDTLGLNNEMLQEMNDSMIQVSMTEWQDSYKYYMDQQKNLARAEQAYNRNRNATTLAALEKAKEAEAKALAEMNDKWSAALEQAAQALQDNISLIMESFEESLLGIGQSFEKMSEVYNQQSQLSGQYLADYKKVYELNKLSRDIQNSIDDSNNIKSKQMLNDLQLELNTLQQSGVKMSEYDLDYLQKKYNLRLAEIALEESQNAKNQVRLQKTANGSWGYVYTQNEETINKAQQEYEDKLYNLQELNNSYLDTVSQQILSTQSEFESAIMEIYSAGLSPEEQQARIDQTVRYYQSRLQFLTMEFDKVIEHNQGLQNMVQSFQETLLGKHIYKNYDGADNIYNTFDERVNGENGLLKQLEKASTEYGETINKFFETMDTSIGNFSDKVLANIEKIQLSIANLGNAYDDNLFESTTVAIYGAITQLEAMEALIEKGYSLNELSKLTEKGLANLYTKVFGAPKDIFGWDMKYTGFDTGGYTGEWGPSGRLAMLHEKEIVLNDQDTENLLAAVDLIRRISQTIDIEAAAAKTTSLLSNHFKLPNNNNTVQQEVTIHAEFPNATDHTEIEQAFDSLINRASQFVNRK